MKLLMMNWACAFRNIMKNLTGMVGNFLSQIIDKFINTPMCAIKIL